MIQQVVSCGNSYKRSSEGAVAWDCAAVPFGCAKHGTNLASESLATGFYRQV